MKRLRCVLPVTMSMLFAAALLAGEQSKQALKIEADEKAGTQPHELRYLLGLPADYESKADAKWPLVLFLHGSGERGDDLEKVKIHGPPKLLAAGKDLGAIVVSPQCPMSMGTVMGMRRGWNAEELA